MYNTDLPNRSELPSSKKLLLSTIFAIIAAGVLLITVVLPSEYGIDPTRVGRILGLTQMGEIKNKLAVEAQKDRDADMTAATPKVDQPETKPAVATKAEAKSDSMSITLKPGEGVEVKLAMLKGAKVKFDWKSSGGPVNYDLHGDGSNKAFISYKKGIGVDSDAGEFIADFEGTHGWFWRNRTNGDVTITLKTDGEYSSIKRVV